MEESVVINEALKLIQVKKENFDEVEDSKDIENCDQFQNGESESEDSSSRNKDSSNPFLNLLDILPLKVELKELAQNFPEDHFLANTFDIEKMKRHSHTLQTTGVNDLRCEECDESFTVKLAWVAHMKQIHNNPKPFVCPHCSAGFGKTNALNTHIDTIHKKLRPYVCNDCNTSYGLKTTLTRHMLTVHSEDKPFQCGDCGACFPLKGRLTFHVNSVHRHIRPFSCSECGSSFSLKGDLKKHINAVHRGLKPFHCDLCGNNFSRKSKLTSHVNTIHKRLRPFSCSDCEATFTTKCLLTNHVNAKHLKLKPFACVHCDAAFVKRDGLKNHLKKSKCRDSISETLIDAPDESLLSTDAFLRLAQDIHKSVSQVALGTNNGFQEISSSDPHTNNLIPVGETILNHANITEDSSLISEITDVQSANVCLSSQEVHSDQPISKWTS